MKKFQKELQGESKKTAKSSEKIVKLKMEQKKEQKVNQRTNQWRDLWINGLEIKDSFLAKLIAGVKGRKEFRLLLDSIIIEQIREFSYTNFSKLKKVLLKVKSPEEFAKSELFRECIKFSRAKLRKQTGLYLKTKDERGIFTSSNFDGVSVKRMLLAHKSSFERYDSYPMIYDRIFKVFKKYHRGKPKGRLRIFDIGCGLNPLSYVFIDEGVFLNSVYFALDIDKRALEVVGRFFQNKNLKYKLFHQDILSLVNRSDSKELSLLPVCDLAFAFKVLESIEKKGHKNSERLISSLKVKMIIASFPKKTISGKNMKVSRKPWLERMLDRLRYRYEIFEIPSEIFYIILKA